MRLVWGEVNKEEKEKKENNGESNKTSYVDMINNHIYFYSDVCDKGILQLDKKLKELDSNLMSEAACKERAPDPIFLHISSYGGSLLFGVTGMESILQTRAPVTTIVEGCCASAATFLSVVGKPRKMGRHSYMLIHQLSAITWGKYTELKDDQVNFDRFMKMIKDIYLQYTKVPEKEIDEILKHDLWFDSAKCLKYGLVDKLI